MSTIVSVPECPSCGASADQLMQVQIRASGHDNVVEVCKSCHNMWEPLPAGHIDPPDEPPMPFPEPCDDCAFRPGSPEQSDPAQWQQLMNELQSPGHAFFCHKGIPFGRDGKGYQQPTREDGSFDTERMRHCRGYINMQVVLMKREMETTDE